jgi:membrane protease YdiL (CAAX protease family)
MFSKTPILTFMSAVIIAPLLEELVFRKSFRYMFSNNILFILFSGITFGAFHVVGSFETFFDLIYIIPYSVPGLVFAYTLVKSKNIFVPMGLHFLHNGILMSLQFLVMFFS